MQNWSDDYSQRAKEEDYPARSVYKLKEIQKKYRLIKKGDRILDLGCAPGSWSLYAAKLIGKQGKVLGLDLQEVIHKMPLHVETLVMDVLEIDWEWLDEQDLINEFDVILSDMAPSTTGTKMLDATRSFQLCQAALNITEFALKPGGSFVCKIFQGEDFNEFLESVKERFRNHRIFKPHSSRKESREIYVLGIGYRGYYTKIENEDEDKMRRASH